MKDFEELEGLQDQDQSLNDVVIDDDEDDGSFRPANVMNLFTFHFTMITNNRQSRRINIT